MGLLRDALGQGAQRTRYSGQNDNYGYTRNRGSRDNGGAVGLIVQGVAAGIGLASESMKQHKDNKRNRRGYEDERSDQQRQQQWQPEQRQQQWQPEQRQQQWQPEQQQQQWRQDGQRYSPPESPSYPSQYQPDYRSGTPPRDEAPPRDGSVDSTIAISEQLDEAAWTLDDAQESTREEPIDEPPPYSVNNDEAYTSPAPEAPSFLLCPPPPGTPLSPLPLPVILTQRRPNSRTRGFIRAYAPVLADAGIPQPTFLAFIDQLNKSVQPSPWIQAINVAAFATGFAPEPFMMAVSAALTLIGRAAGETHSRSRTNAFLANANENFFRPRGLVALLMTWRPEEAGSALVDVDFDMHCAVTHANTSGARRRLAASNGATAFNWPEMAPLVFPELDAAAAADATNPTNPDGSKAAEANRTRASSLRRKGRFVQEYMDRRARASWADANPSNSVAQAAPRPEFRSRYADPSHPAASGDILGLLTGGSHTVRSVRQGTVGVVEGVRSGVNGMRESAGGGLTGSGGSRGSGSGSGSGGPLGGLLGSGDNTAGLRELLGESRLAGRLGARVESLGGRVDRIGGGGGRLGGGGGGGGLLGGRGLIGGALAAVAAPAAERASRGGSGARSQRGLGGLGGGLLENGPGGLISGAKKLFSSDVLYLLIVNMPTPEEMARGQEMLAERSRRFG